MYKRKLSPEEQVALVEQYKRGEGSQPQELTGQLLESGYVTMMSMDRKCF